MVANLLKINKYFILLQKKVKKSNKKWSVKESKYLLYKEIKIVNKGFKKFQQKPNTFDFSTGCQEIKLDQLQYTPIIVILNIFLFHYALYNLFILFLLIKICWNLATQYGH